MGAFTNAYINQLAMRGGNALGKAKKVYNALNPRPPLQTPTGQNTGFNPSQPYGPTNTPTWATGPSAPGSDPDHPPPGNLVITGRDPSGLYLRGPAPVGPNGQSGPVSDGSDDMSMDFGGGDADIALEALKYGKSVTQPGMYKIAERGPELVQPVSRYRSKDRS